MTCAAALEVALRQTCRYLQVGVDNEHDIAKSKAKSILAGQSAIFATES